MLIPKLFTCLKTYNKEKFFKDFVSGIIVAIIALPLSIALAIASGVSPEKGLYTAIIGALIVSLFGGSRVQIAGPTGAFVVIVFGIIQKYGFDGLIIATIMAGVILVLMGLLKMGNVIKYIPYTITAGFTSGIAITIFSTQIKDFFGLTMKEVPSEFLPKWIAYIKAMPTTNVTSLAVGVAALLIIIFWPKVNKKIPGTLIAILAVTIITSLFHLKIATIGSIYNNLSATLPNLTIPSIKLSTINALMMPAITIAILGGVESLLSAVVADGMIGRKHDSNMELVAQGMANIGSALFGGIPVTGAIARTAANVKNGARSPMAGIIHSVVLLAVMIILMPYVKLIPMSSLAAVLMVVSYNMGEWDVFGRLKKAPRHDVLVFLVTFFLTIFMDLVVAILVGMVLASFLFMKRMADYTDIKCLMDEEDNKECLELMEDIETPEDVTFYEISGPFFFGAADKFVSLIKEMGVSPKVLILKMSKVPIMDATAYHALRQLEEICEKNKTQLIMLKVKEQPMGVLRDYGFVNKLGVENFCNDMEQAIKRANCMLDEVNIA